ncbi:alcohol dehydrogenase catalytic domain-containing protein [Paracoccus alcaliphilus]|uniref:alcohol dehydrogenase catalytic domain-containing protein n=1 Tax=Paracoccus alcaliphilus TaxID=34002 RepID=UPI000B84873E|nr:alcohol dehydrogenase catalytic domain-containing protein [Paracoccus alcaliphilus]
MRTCGTDLAIYQGAHPQSRAPLVLGHEFVARVAKGGDGFIRDDCVVSYPLISCGRPLSPRPRRPAFGASHAARSGFSAAHWVAPAAPEPHRGNA